MIDVKVIPKKEEILLIDVSDGYNLPDTITEFYVQVVQPSGVVDNLDVLAYREEFEDFALIMNITAHKLNILNLSKGVYLFRLIINGEISKLIYFLYDIDLEKDVFDILSKLDYSWSEMEIEQLFTSNITVDKRLYPIQLINITYNALVLMSNKLETELNLDKLKAMYNTLTKLIKIVKQQL